MSRRCFTSVGRCSLAVTGIISCLLPLTGSAETYSSLPPPPQQNTPGQQQQQYMLGLVVNDQDSGQVVPVEFRDNHYLLRAGDLQRAGIPTARITSSIMDVSTMAEVKAVYDQSRQRILLTVPPGWLPTQTLTSKESNGPRYPGRTTPGALFNYDLYTSHTSASGTRLSAWNEFRLFGNQGQFATNGVYQQQLSGTPGAQDEGYLRYDTWWSNQNENHSLSWRVGDLTTDSLSWSNSVRLGGVRIGRDFSIRPDLITYPLPSFSGQAAVPSTVDLFVNGYKNSTNSVQPGPWSLTNMPFVNGAGNAVVVTTDAVGRRVSTTLPFYVSSELLKPGLSDFSFSAGALRENYGIKNFDYGAGAVSGSYRYGLNDWLTLESHAEGAESLALGGAGGQLRIGSLGVINAALTQSQMQGEHGNQYSWGYQYNNSRFSVGTQHIVRSAGFGNLALYGDRNSGVAGTEYTLSRRSAQYSASLSLNQYGSLGAAFIDITSGTGDRTQLWNLSWSKNLWGNSSLYVSASRDQQQGEWSGAISLLVPFSDLGTASVSVERDQQGGTSQRITASRAMPSQGGLAWDASWANQSSGSDYRQGSLSWRNNNIETSAGFYGDDEYSTEWADITGSVVLMDGSLFAANQVTDAFVLVKTDYPNIKVRYENQLMGHTDDKGYLLVPGISSWYPAKYDIDTLDLPADMTTSHVEQRFAVKRDSGYLLHFPVEPLRAASVILHDQNGQPLPVSTQLIREGQATEYVGWDGLVWMENLSSQNPFRAETPDGRHCEAALAVPGGRPKSLETYGPLTCSLSPDPSSGTPP
ncbi:fimbria/pilus outer membrane usher protein [Erwinia sp. MMLR14_017]|uniref:fimbria/pilus outer membrane usher protein n=1 Tax=Erwinia sp. MMLR14_017 TaxID=3093842 RepID=UPI00298F6667|nr:fimbria/pilus outer membrane usher protein [Erwinia sp. MMLR14_017]MDW8845444.1 fimbria/pilus outer membrane usher protein [Erwinia sp. MMLR14_017]